ncbi:hypothetical protein DI09_32p50 [Mitosporidium daphniae]|uniref:Ferric oxidoreductase domain-containing protein n=1 Tax=Mitosporidium daphniae TaxID=1485682 RepID=A0A098VRE1_9MICR|nr:uncharacterized protein DI09_32p50 [Mitosporidium daphniae]KGG51520.1 hypothetical protein DI09_32p50 [Mitosporidium daphniae]|eukprot:XP_013237972.1 uncharacterized protein DI09_32p50 [Mitosporidium daphniae]
MASSTDQAFSSCLTDQAFSSCLTDQAFSSCLTDQEFSSCLTNQALSSPSTDRTFSSPSTDQALSFSTVPSKTFSPNLSSPGHQKASSRCLSMLTKSACSFFSSRTFLIGAWVIFQMAIFLFRAISTLTDSLYSSSRLVFGALSLAIARGSSLPIAIDSGLVLLPASLQLLSISPWGLFGYRIAIHRLISLSIIFWSIVHSLGHLVNFFYSAFHLATTNLPKINSPTITSSFFTVLMALFGSVAGISGLFLVSLLVTLFIFSYSIKNYESFWWVHRIVFPLYYVALGKFLRHAQKCFVFPILPFIFDRDPWIVLFLPCRSTTSGVSDIHRLAVVCPLFGYLFG